MTSTLITLAIIGVVIAFMYNFLVGKKNEVDNIFGGIDAILKKRYNLIPNLVESIKQYVTHERETLEKITQLRSKAMRSKNSDEKLAINNELSSMLGGIMVAVENYPDLKANQNFLHLQKTLNELEAQVSAARRAYNQAVTDYNNAIEMFPSNIIANFMGYKAKEVFQAKEVERENPNLKNPFTLTLPFSLR